MNKKFLILAIGACLSVSSVFAQVKIDRGYGNSQTEKTGKTTLKRNSVLVIKYGVKAGVTLSNMSNNMTFDPEFSMGTGFQAGALINLHWGQRTASSLPGTGLWGLQPEILFFRLYIQLFAPSGIEFYVKCYPHASFSVVCCGSIFRPPLPHRIKSLQEPVIHVIWSQIPLPCSAELHILSKAQG